MTKQNMTAWFFESGIIGIPKNLLGLMEPLRLTFEDIGKIVYLLYCGADQIDPNDNYAVEAAKSLHAKGILNWLVDQNKVDFSPMFDKIGQFLGEAPVYVDKGGVSAETLAFSDIVKKFEREFSRFMTVKEKQDIMEAVQRYNWSYELIYEILAFYQKNYRRHSYDFMFFCKMAFGAKVEDSAGFARFVESLESSNNRVLEVLRRIGKYNNPTEAQKEMYLKWNNLWKFSHEMILQAADDTINANNPSFGYIDSILNNWLEEGITSSEKLQEKKKAQAVNKQKAKGPQNLKKQGPKENFAAKSRDLSFLVE